MVELMSRSLKTIECAPLDVPKIEWTCFPHLITGVFDGFHTGPGLTIDAKTVVIIMQAPLVVGLLRSVIYDMDHLDFGKIFFHRFTFPDEDAFIWARKLGEGATINFPD